MHLTSHIIDPMAMPRYIAHYRSNGFDQRFRKHWFWMKLNPPNAHRSQIKICEKRQTRNVQFWFMPNAFRILKPIQKSSKCVWVFRNTGANAFAKNQTRLAYEDKRDLYCTFHTFDIIMYVLTSWHTLIHFEVMTYFLASCHTLHTFADISYFLTLCIDAMTHFP